MAKSLAKQWFERVWNNADADAIAKLFHSKGKTYGIYGEPSLVRMNSKKFHTTSRNAFDNIRIEIIDEVACMKKIAVRGVAEVIERRTGKDHKLRGMCIFTVKKGKLKNCWNYWDFLDLLESMQLMPENSFERAVSGTLQAHPSGLKPSPSVSKRLQPAS